MNNKGEKVPEGEEPDGKKLDRSKVCFLSNFPPKECGIATFTKDLTTAMNKLFNPKLKSKVIALNDGPDFYNYSSDVILQVDREDTEDFFNTARKINKTKEIRLVCIQHEFGLFGGDYGEHVIHFLEAVEKPVVITFHSVLPDPDEGRKRVVADICSKCAATIVMAKKAVEILRDDYGVDESKIHVVRHGIPNVQFNQGEDLKKKLRLQGRTVLSTFGLLSRGKGIEYMIRALPKLVEKYPDLLYLVIGETHPVVRQEEGESYRNELIEEVNKLGLSKNVKFYNKYLTLQEIISYLLASDIYICTSLEKNQIVSGTLSYALGCGKPVVSTPSLYAEEVLSNGRGLLGEFKNPDSYAVAVDKILSDKELRNNLERNSYSFARHMVWPNVASRYLNIFNKVVKLREETTEKFPAVKLNHLRALTDNFGIIQFSKLSTPDLSSGYTVDDNARALIAAVLHNSIYHSPVSFNLARIYLGFLEAAQDEAGWFNNIINGDKVLNDSEDAFGRAMWALGYVIDVCSDKEICDRAKVIFDKSYRLIDKLTYLRAKAFTVIGLYHYYKKFAKTEILLKIRELADDIVDHYEKESSEEWNWFEHDLTYSNSKLPEAMLLVYELTGDRKYFDVGDSTLDFLSDILFVDGRLSPVGQNGWCNRNGERAFFDQQPVDASSAVQTFLTAYNITKNKAFHRKAVLAFNWFLGKNHLKQTMYDETTGGCYDGLKENAINLNQGAESGIAYLIARLSLEKVKREGKV